MISSYLFIILAFLIGFGLAWFIARQNKAPDLSDDLNHWQTEAKIWQSKSQSAEEREHKLAVEMEEARTGLESRGLEIAKLKAQIDHQDLRLKEQKNELSDLQKQFEGHFKNLAQQILEEKSAKFTQANKENMETILKPLSERIKDFQEKVQQTNVEGAQRNAALVQQITSLKELNTNLQAEAHTLSKALRGESKTQGNWGEFQLEGILDAAGLQKDIHYRKEANFKNEADQNQRPDFFIDLPDGKHLVLDAKVSLTAFLRYTESEDEIERNQYLKEHLLSLHGHIDGLSKKNYQDLPGTNQPDYVLLFVANEPALHAAIAEDAKLFEKALQKNIVLVSTSTLLATLRTINYIWRQDAQNKNADEIARQAGMMYDKFVNFTDDLIKVGQQMDTSRKTYDAAMNKLKEGRGNLISRALKLDELGGRQSAKKIDNRLLDNFEEED